MENHFGVLTLYLLWDKFFNCGASEVLGDKRMD
jgi:hypothetical protein